MAKRLASGAIGAVSLGVRLKESGPRVDRKTVRKLSAGFLLLVPLDRVSIGVSPSF